jgi:hypothetical protein
MTKDANPDDQLEDQFANEVGTLRNLAVKSSDPLVVAKAVAASDEAVRQLILARLRASERLVEVFAFQGTAQHELQVFFRFVPAKEVAHLLDAGVLVFVDLHKGEVIGTVDPFILQSARLVARPFVTVAALKTFASASCDQEKTLVAREQAFFRSMGLGGGLGGDGDTVCNTDVTSTTYSGKPYRPDDTGRETTGDYCDSPGPIVA